MLRCGCYWFTTNNTTPTNKKNKEKTNTHFCVVLCFVGIAGKCRCLLRSFVCVCWFGVVVSSLQSTTQKQKKTTKTRSNHTHTSRTTKTTNTSHARVCFLFAVFLLFYLRLLFLYLLVVCHVMATPPERFWCRCFCCVFWHCVAFVSYVWLFRCLMLVCVLFSLPL